MAGETNPGRHSDLGSILDRGDDFLRGGDPRAAMAFYQAAMEATVDPNSLDQPTITRLRAAKAFIEHRAEDFRAGITRTIADHPSTDPVEQLRLRHALEMLEGKREIFLQQPTVLFYPYLAQRQFWEAEEFDWAAGIEAATPYIREELVALLDDDAEFRPYVEDAPNRPSRPFLTLNNDPSWSALYLWRDSLRNDAIADRCPKTMAALEKVPLTRIGRRTPSALFSRLEPGAHIPPHHGMLNCRMICHLPLIVPPGCTLRVGNEMREWREGKLMIFDDSFEHEARNPTNELRIILLFDVWRPELGQAERDAISAIFSAIDDFRELPDA